MEWLSSPAAVGALVALASTAPLVYLARHTKVTRSCVEADHTHIGKSKQ